MDKSTGEKKLIPKIFTRADISLGIMRCKFDNGHLAVIKILETKGLLQKVKLKCFSCDIEFIEWFAK
jgi:saccharopine dehydrogenase-like NADP-dependent oxidoreductase